MPHPNATGRRCRDEDAPLKRVPTIDEYMASYGPGRTTTYNLINTGRLKAVKLNRRTFILRDSAEELLASLPTLKADAA